MNYLQIDSNNIITDFVTSDSVNNEDNLKELYTGARIGDYYLPPNIIEDKIIQSKVELENFLIHNPLYWKDGKYYSVTLEKQNLLTSNIATYQIESQFNENAVITWNSKDEVCENWNINDLIELAVAIKTYVKPIITRQQELELEIKNCTSPDEVKNVYFNYSSFAVQPYLNNNAGNVENTENTENNESGNEN